MSGIRQNRGRHWSDEGDNLLRSMSPAGKSLTIMTVKLDRPMTSIRACADDLRIGIPGTEIGWRKRRRGDQRNARARECQSMRPLSLLIPCKGLSSVRS